MNSLPRNIRDKELEEAEQRMQDQHSSGARRNEIVIAEGLQDTLKPDHEISDQKLDYEDGTFNRPPDATEQFHDQGVNADLIALDDVHDNVNDEPVHEETSVEGKLDSGKNL